MNRLDRLSAILIQLQSRRVVKAQHIADRYQISLRTVYRDIRTLEEGGIPIIGEAGIGYTLAQGYKLPPIMFSREEATAFLTAEKLISRFTDAENSASYQSAMDKVRAVLKSSEQHFLENIDNRIEVLQSRKPVQKVTDNLIQTILTAIADKLVLDLEYFAHYRQESTSRHVEPIGIFYLDQYWHLIAFCRSRKAIRDFRFDRVRHICLLECHYEDIHEPFATILSRLYKNLPLIPVRILVDKAAYLHLGEQKYYQGFVSEQETPEGMQVDFMTVSIEGFARWYMSFADFAVVLSPDVLRDRVAAIHKASEKNIELMQSC